MVYKPDRLAPNASRMRLVTLEKRFGKLKCMVVGCGYDKVLEVHRHVPGRSGGLYEIGNMFTVCPNHHAEVTRGITTLVKLSDDALEIIESEQLLQIAV